MTQRRAFVLLLLVSACGGAPVAAPPVEPKCAPAAAPTPAAMVTAPAGDLVDTVEAELVKRIGARDAKGVVDLFSPPMRDALPEEEAGPWIDGVLGEKGRLTTSTRIPGRGSARHAFYQLVAERGLWQLEVHVGADGKILGLKVTEPPQPDPPVVRSTASLTLPFHGKWSVFWGGDKLEVNHHVTHASQRRAADLVVRGADGRTRRGDGKRNEDYLAYGQEILAVADGEVVTVIDGVLENVPGSMNPYAAFGNVVVLKHDDELYSVYAHLQSGKMRVKRGAKVKRGSVLGLCGNSGNSSEPHLHFQLQDGPRMEESWGIEPVFRNVSVTRENEPMRTSEYTWLKGDLVGEELPPRR